MISYSQDGVFFNVTSNDIKTKINNKSVISLSITEEQGKLTTGSIVMDDESGAYFSAIKRGAVLSIEWGYTSQGLLPGSFRKGLAVMVVSPSHEMGMTQTTTINFRSGFTMIKDRKRKTYHDTKRNTVNLVMVQAGILKPIIDFDGSSEKGQYKQDSETDFQFLARLAREWKKQFLVGTSLAGVPVGIFSEYKSTQAKTFLSLTTGNISFDNLFEYRAGIRNVISASVEENFSESGGGNQVRFVLIDGQAVTQATDAQTEIVKTLKLDSDALLREQKRIANRDGRAAALAWTKDIIDANDFEDANIKRFWVEVDYKTAAPHSGMKVIVSSFGNPFYSIPSPARLGAGFPSSVANSRGPTGTSYEIKRVTHSIGSSGYMCEVEIRNYLNL